jgi:sorbose reductase
MLSTKQSRILEAVSMSSLRTVWIASHLLQHNHNSFIGGIPWTQGELLYGEVSHYRKVIATNLDGVFFCARSAGKHFKRQKFEGTDVNGKKLENYTYGSFIATASMSGHIVNFPQLQAVYNSSKAAVIHLAKSLAVEWVKFARVNTVSPAYINTEISDFVPKETKAIWKGKTPMGREGEAGELKGGFLYFACDASSYTTGADLIIDVSRFLMIHE